MSTFVQQKCVCLFFNACQLHLWYCCLPCLTKLCQCSTTLSDFDTSGCLQCLCLCLFRTCLCFWCHCLTLIKQSLSAPVQLKGSVGCGYLGCCWGLTTPFFYPPHPPSPSFHQFLMLFNNNDQNMPNSGTVQYCILFTLGIVVHQS